MDNTQGKIRFGASSAPHKLKLIMLIVNRDKVEFYTDFLQDFEVNMQAVTMARDITASRTRGHRKSGYPRRHTRGSRGGSSRRTLKQIQNHTRRQRNSVDDTAHKHDRRRALSLPQQ